jgi:hypothetical protein
MLLLAVVTAYFALPSLGRFANGVRSPVALPPSTSGGVPQPGVSPQPQPPGGLEVDPSFRDYWSANGGRSIFGNPISPLITELTGQGQEVTVQYFELSRFELVPKDQEGTQFKLQLARLGLEVPVTGMVANPLPEGLQADQVTFDATGMSTPRKFFAFWEQNGGLDIFGYPITPVLVERTSSGEEVAVQYFERARLEYHPEFAGTPNEVQLGPLGIEVYNRKYGRK